MKSIALSALVMSSLILTSCKPSICDCKKMGTEFYKEMTSAKTEADQKKVNDKWQAKFKPCEELGKNKSKEEQKKMLEEFEKCK
jgi:predicted  nucleic acid-binding Zn ribbon protein